MVLLHLHLVRFQGEPESRYLECSPLMSLRDFHEEIRSVFNITSRFSVAWRGQILSQSDSISLLSLNVEATSKSFYIAILANGNIPAPQPQFAQNSVPRHQPRPQHVPPQHHQDEDDERICRICFSGEEIGRLFSPCMCRGTMRYIHVECLNRWRLAAPQNTSYYKCDQCHHEYDIRRADWAQFISEDRYNFSVVLTLIFFIAAVFVVGWVGSFFNFADWAMDKLEWDIRRYFAQKACQPGQYYEFCYSSCASFSGRWYPWSDCNDACRDWCRALPLGDRGEYLIQVSISGILISAAFGLYLQRELIWNDGNWHRIVIFLALSSAYFRMFAVIGIGHSFYYLMMIIRNKIQGFMFQFGERILEPDIHRQHAD